MPKKGTSKFDNKDDWISYCVFGSPEMKKEFSDEDQRFAVCYSYWDSKWEPKIEQEIIGQIIRDELSKILEYKAGGDCFEANGREFIELATKDDTMKLVHGEVTGQGKVEGKRFWHCWIEVGNRTVLDFSERREITMDKDDYYEIGKIDERQVKKYDHDTVLKNIIKHEHWGPW